MLAQVEPELMELGDLSGGELYRQQLQDYAAEPELTTWGAWGERIDRIEHTALWKKAERIAAEKGIVATAYERKNGALSRVHQFALMHVIEPSWSIYSCPLAMTDGAARTLIASPAEV